MKVPLEPIPTEQIMIVKPKAPKGGLRASDNTQMHAGMISHGDAPAEAGQLEKAYPWLLGVSTCLSALLCWMYVTKPVIVNDVVGAPAAEAGQELVARDAGKSDNAVVPVTTSNEPSLMPSSDQLPSANPSAKAVAAQNTKVPEVIDPRMLSQARHEARERGVGVGWEKTNLKVQHILSADTGTGENEKIVINVPVLYETRSMRWTPDKIEQAREVLARLMLYERNLNNLRNEGSAILADWNAIIKDTVPASTLRADSPSLPYNHGQENEPMILPGSSSVIQVEEK